MATRIDIRELLIWAFRDQAVEVAGNADPDAVTVYWAVLALPVPHANLVRRHARAATMPDWHPDTTTPTVSLESVRRARLVYTEWVRAMVVLRRTLDGTLARFAATGPALDQEPWITARRRAMQQPPGVIRVRPAS